MSDPIRAQILKKAKEAIKKAPVKEEFVNKIIEDNKYYYDRNESHAEKLYKDKDLESLPNDHEGICD